MYKKIHNASDGRLKEFESELRILRKYQLLSQKEYDKATKRLNTEFNRRALIKRHKVMDLED